MNLLLRDELATILAEEIAAMPSGFRDDAIDLPVLDQSDRARAIRRITEIVNARDWQLEVIRALDRHKANYVSDLEDSAVFDLCARMEYLEDCVQTGCDADDAPPAR